MQGRVQIASIFPRSNGECIVYCGEHRRRSIGREHEPKSKDRYGILFSSFWEAMKALEKTAELRVTAFSEAIPESQDYSCINTSQVMWKEVKK